jgi:photosystem II stability/assembly factor-like uncharacterized protein
MKYIKSALILVVIALFLAACDSGNGDGNGQNTPGTTEAPVNGFGVSSNHVHSLVVLPSHVLLLATHYGIYRSQDDGATWQLVAGGSGQLMEDLMEYKMTVSPLNPQRLFVLTQPTVLHPKGIPGVYTSADGGLTWKLSVADSTISSTYPTTETAGNDTPDEVYLYQSELGNLGLKRSLDDGQHFSTTGTLPFASIFGILALPDEPGHLIVYGSQGIARSTDGGIHWQVVPGINGSVQEMTIAAAHQPIYAAGDAGVYTSTDDGKTFKLVYDQHPYLSLAVTPQNPQLVYGKTGTTLYRSSDGGRTWTPLPHLSGGTFSVLAVVPNDPSEIYVSLSYPTEMYRLNANGTGWTSLTPPAKQG